MVTNTPSTQAAGAGMSAPSTARSDSTPVDNTTSANTIIAASASGKPIAPLIHNKPASGSATTALAAITRSAPESIATALDNVVLVSLESDPQRQSHQAIGHRVGHAHSAADPPDSASDLLMRLPLWIGLA